MPPLWCLSQKMDHMIVKCNESIEVDVKENQTMCEKL